MTAKAPTAKAPRPHGTHHGVPWRSHEISRMEALSDAVFALAITLLIVALEAPETFAELWTKMHGLPAFALSFAMLFYLWNSRVWLHRTELALSHEETFDAWESVEGNLIMVSAAALSLAVLFLSGSVSWSGLSYFSISVARTTHGWLRGRQRRKKFALVYWPQ